MRDNRESGAHREIVGALRRADRNRPLRATRPSDIVRLAAVACIAAGFVLEGVTVLVALFVVGSAALWLSFHYDDTNTQRDIAAAFDRSTGLPLAPVLETVLADDLATRSLNGRLAVVAVEVPELAARRAAGDHRAADALLTSIVHRLQSHGWVDGADGPFAPLVFLRRPAVFYVVLRDVLDERTTRWLAGRMFSVLDEPVRWSGEQLAPRVALGLALGRSGDGIGLVWQANDARRRARRAGGGAVVFAAETLERVGPVDEEWLVRLDDGTSLGRVFRPAISRGEMFAELAAFLHTFDEAATWAATGDERAVVVVPSTTLLHWGAPSRITARINADALHGRIALLAPAGLADRDVEAIHDTLARLRRVGVDVYVDRGTDPAPAATDGRFDGVVVAADHGAAPTVAGLVVATIVTRDPAHEAPDTLAEPASAEAALHALMARGGTDRPESGGRSAQLPQGPWVGAR